MPSSTSNAPNVRHFRMQSRRTAVAAAVARILKAVAEVGLNTDRRQDLEVALTEALSNAAVHGNRLKPGTQVRVAVATTPGVRAIVDIKDSGQGFDFDALADPTDPERLLEAGGRGVYLMKQLVDRLEYRDGGSRVLLTMERHKRDPD